jgi:hypothetical protein
MTNEKHDEERHDDESPEFRRSLMLDIGAVATPAAILAQPVVKAWADQHFSKGDKSKGESPQMPEK